MAAKRSELVFSKTRIQGLPLPAKGRTYHYDARTPGLCVCVTDKGTRTFYSYRWVQSRPVRVRIGAFPAVTVQNARKKAAEINAAVARGEDPQAKRRQARQEPTFGDLWEHWLETHAKLHKRTWQEDVRVHDQFLTRWANRRLSSVRRVDVQRLHARVGRENGIYQANRLLELVRAVFNKAEDIGFRGDNPGVGVRAFREKSRDRFLVPEEMPRFFQALASETNDTARDAILLLLFTGARLGNVLAMRWADIDFGRAVWRIPETKNDQPVIVPLTPLALDVLHRRSRIQGNSPWVLPGRTGHLTTLRHVWKGFLARAGITDLRIHDLRRTLGSWQAMQGASLLTIGKSLGHTDPAATAVYARLLLDPVRESTTQATAAMLAAGGLLEAPNEQEGENDAQT